MAVEYRAVSTGEATGAAEPDDQRAEIVTVRHTIKFAR